MTLASSKLLDARDRIGDEHPVATAFRGNYPVRMCRKLMAFEPVSGEEADAVCMAAIYLLRVLNAGAGKVA